MQIVFRQEIGAKLQIVIEVERATGFKSRAKGRHGGGFGKFPHALDSPELALSVVLGHLGAAASAAVVVVGGHAVMRVLLLLLVVVVVGVQKGGHDDGWKEEPAPED